MSPGLPWVHLEYDRASTRSIPFSSQPMAPYVIC